MPLLTAKALRALKRAKAPREGTIQESVIGYARRSKRWRCTKRSRSGSFGHSGEPDFDCMCKKCRAGHIFMIEFKAPGEVPSEKQQECIDEIRYCGIRVYVVDNKEEGRKVIDKEGTLCANSSVGSSFSPSSPLRGRTSQDGSIKSKRPRFRW
jgi:hypothetical protein